MTGPLQPPSLVLFRALAQGSALSSVGLALGVLVGGASAMTPHAAVGVALLGTALALLLPRRARLGRRVLGRACATGALLLGAITLLEQLTGRSLGLNALLPRPSINTSASILLLGASLLLLERRAGARVPWTDVLVLPALLSALLASNAYLHGGLASLDAPERFAPIGTRLLTAPLLLLLGVGILCARPERGLMARLAQGSIGGVLARRLAPLALLGPPVVSAAVKQLAELGLLGEEAKMPLFSTVASVGGVALVLLSAWYLDALDAERQRAMVALAASEERLRGYLSSAQRAREEAEEQHARLQTVLEQAPVGVLVLDPTKDEVFANDALQMLFARPLRPAEGRRQYLTLLRHVDDRPLALEELPTSRALRGQVVPAEEYLLVRADERRVPVLISAAPVRGPGGEVRSVVATVLDISTRRELEQLREEYVGLVSHDLRNPLNNISLRLRMLERALREKGLTRELAIAGTLQQGARRMEGMIDELLESTRLEAGRVELRREAVELPHFLEEVLERDVPPGERARFTLEVSGPVPPVPADAARLERVVANLLTNAVKYTPPRTPVTVRLAREGGRVVVSVKDAGPGLRPEEVAHLFEKYYRTRSGQVAEGSGLGLYISRLIIESHGGRIWVESTPGGGTTFSFCLPLEEAREWEAARPEPHAGL